MAKPVAPIFIMSRIPVTVNANSSSSPTGYTDVVAGLLYVFFGIDRDIVEAP
jgi:hypothetical protein